MRLKLADLFVKPMQRVTKYALLLKAILGKTNEDDERTSLENMVNSPSFIHLFIYSFIHLFIYSFIHLFLFIYFYFFMYLLLDGNDCRATTNVELPQIECY